MNFLREKEFLRVLFLPKTLQVVATAQTGAQLSWAGLQSQGVVPSQSQEPTYLCMC